MRGGASSRHADCVRIRWPLLVLGLFLTGCIGTPPSASVAPPTFVARTETPSSAFSPASSTPAATAPIPIGARVPEAGTIYVILGSELIRYDGATGAVTNVGHGAEFSRVAATGAYVVPSGGSASLFAWDGTTTTLDCGVLLRRISVTARGDCAGVRGDLSLTIQQPPEPPHVVIAPGGGALDVAWRPDGAALAVIKRSNQFENTLWVIEPNGSERELYKAPRGGTGDTLFWPTWSPDGSVIAVVLNRFGSFSLGADGGTSLLLVSYPDARVVDLGLVPLSPDRIHWSSGGILAFVRGPGREPAKSRSVIVRDRDGTESSLGTTAVADHPAWDPAGARLVLTETDEQGTRFALIDRRTSGRTTIECPSGDATGARWSSDGASLLLLCHERGSVTTTLWLYELNGVSQRLMTLPQSFTDLFVHLAWSRATP